MDAISWRRAETVPTECQSMGARSEKDSRFLESSRRTPSRWSGLVSCMTSGRSSSMPPPALLFALEDVLEEGGPTAEGMPPAPWRWEWALRLLTLTLAEEEGKRTGMLTFEGGLGLRLRLCERL